MSDILNSNNVNETRFRMSKPQGYFTEDVDKFIDEVVLSSITAYELKIKEITNQQYVSEQKIREMEEELSSLRLKTEFSSSNAAMQNDDMLAATIQKQEALEAENARLVAENKELRDTIDQWEAYSNSLQQKVEEYESGGTAPATVVETYEPEPTPVAEPVAYEPEPTPVAEPVAYEPEPTPVAEPVAYEPEPTPVVEPASTTSTPVTEFEQSFSDTILNSDLEISEEELAAVLAEVGDDFEDDLYISTDKIDPEDLK